MPNEPNTAPPEEASTSRSLIVREDGERLDAWLARHCAPLSRSRLQTLIETGQVTVDGRATTIRAKTRAGQQVVVTLPPPEPARPSPEDIPLDVVFEDADILVLDKPPGVVVHPAPGHRGGTLVNALLHHCDDLGGVGGVERPGIVHRLDKDTSGLLVVAKHDAALNALAAQFQNGRVRKVYLALVHGVPAPPAGRIATTIGRHPVDRKRMAANPPRGKSAVSNYAVVETFGDLALLKVGIETGRTHQIRVHLAHLGFPIVGDPVYGNPGRDRKLDGCPSRQMLHAAELELDHPGDGRRLKFTRPPPADMTDFLLSRRRLPNVLERKK
jgi:23S rRNA pseudouridine1911/1915/1917 synthase